MENLKKDLAAANELRFLPDQVELWDLDKLIADARNPRTHSDQQIAEIADSMQRFGMMTVILADRAGNIIAGRARVLAARKLGLQTIPVVIADHLSESERRAYAIADNKIPLNAGWDESLLKIEIDKLSKEGFDPKSLGFDTDELKAIADRLARSIRLEDEDAAPARLPDAVTQAGDVWQLGEHQILCADSLIPGSYGKLLEGQVCQMTFSDLPYNVDYSAPAASDGSARHAQIANDNLGSKFPEFLHQACKLMLTHTRGAIYICMSSSELHTLHQAFTKAGGHWSTFIIWAKSTFTLGWSDYMRMFEPILYGWHEGLPHYWCGSRDQGDVWHFDKPRTNDMHPTMKPVALIERAILNSSRRDEYVLDPFGGSGSTLIACEKTGRRARLIEIEPAYCDVIVRRWQEFTGKTALLRDTDSSFETVQGEREVSAEPELEQSPA